MPETLIHGMPSDSVYSSFLQDQILQFANFLDGNETSVANLGSATMSALQVIFAEVDYAWDEGERRLVTSFDEAAANEAFYLCVNLLELVSRGDQS